MICIEADKGIVSGAGVPHPVGGGLKGSRLESAVGMEGITLHPAWIFNAAMAPKQSSCGTVGASSVRVEVIWEDDTWLRRNLAAFDIRDSSCVCISVSDVGMEADVDINIPRDKKPDLRLSFVILDVGEEDLSSLRIHGRVRGGIVRLCRVGLGGLRGPSINDD